MSNPSRSRRHSISQKLVLFVNSLLIIGCFGGAAALVLGQGLVKSQQKVQLVANLADAAQSQLGPSETFPAADPGAKNFLITGADNDSCVDPNSPFAAAFGDRTSLGERSDTIMIMRVDPSTNQAAVLSFPRDLWVSIAGHDGENRINSAYVKNDPSTLVATLYQDFGIGVDHFIQVDFCAFKTLVDAIGGVPVPFELAARDTHTGLYVPQPGCFNLAGDEALAYVRSRHYQTYDEATGKWKEDPLADLGRISRQQDFLRRIIAKALKTGVYTPSVARGLISTAQKYVVTDTNLTPQRMLEFAGTIQNIDPANLHSYQIEVSRDTRSGQDVLIPRLGGSNMKAVLAIFRGKAPLVGAPSQDTSTVIATDDANAAATTTTVAIAGGGAVADAAPVTTVASTDPTAAATAATDNDKGVVPPKGVQC
ncbi:MAG: putative LytR family regulatory protein [Ilumatobacteraceae bacterium]|nr:putative LytR family regulatory protein [Ilumatobacteraceae bacterium]